MPATASSPARVTLDGKFFRLGTERFLVRGVTYGSFGRNAANEPFPERAAVARDFDLVRTLGANTVRIYDVPPLWLLDAAAERGLRILAGIPWLEHTCFLDSAGSRREARTAVRTGVQTLRSHPAILAYVIGNEIPPDILRWSDTRRVAAFLDDLADMVHDLDAANLCTYANFPPTEFLRPARTDFVTFNVFLHTRPALERYLARLQHIAGDRPLLLGECGIDTLREGEAHQAEILGWTLEAAALAGLAGSVVFSFTDEWHRGGAPVTDWAMGLTTADRVPRPSFHTVQKLFQHPPQPPGPWPRVTVVVAAYDAGATLPECLDSLLALRYPDFEVIVVDDGSTDDTPQITIRYPQVRTLRLTANGGLSNARNLGIRAATGEVVAFTDADCRVAPDWLRFLIVPLLDKSVVGVGGPNLLPPEDSALSAVVMAAPGGPVHVMLDDRYAEHIPGCNMAFWKWALDAVDGFDVAFERAGDDVDLCWRLQRRGWKLGFSPAAVVWHHRRPTLKAYLRQQAGYGEAEALLIHKHPAYFNALGSARWQGRICTPWETDSPWRAPVVFRGVFATGLIQTLYTPSPGGLLPLLSSIEFHVLVALPLLIAAFSFPGLWPLVVLAFLIPPAVAVAGAARMQIPRDRSRWWSRPVLALLFYLQPLWRGAARHRGRLMVTSNLREEDESLESASRLYGEGPIGRRDYWSATWLDRREWVEKIIAALERRGWPCRPDSGWNDFDLEIHGTRWARLALITVAEAARDRAQILRCRLRPHWTLAAHLAFWGVLAAEVLIIGVFRVNWRGWWVPLATLGPLAWFLRHQGRIMQAKLSVVLDEVARDAHLTPVPQDRAQRPS